MQEIDRTAEIGIIGLGYVGLKELVAFASNNEKVIGYDINKGKVNMLKKGQSPIGTVSDGEIEKAINIGCEFTTDGIELQNCNYIIVAVPTPLKDNNDPDISYIKAAFKTIKEFFDSETQTIILESTTYPGCSEEMVNEFFPDKKVNYAFCGEREDPGGKCSFENIPRVLGASSVEATKKCKQLYEKIVISVHEVSKPEVAEITKLYENVYRSVNIGLANEFKLLCHKMHIDPYEVINAAKTKPFGFRAFFPGPGLGGHCIPIDPFYLSWAAKKYDLNMQFIELSGIINSQMPYYVVSRLSEALNSFKKSINGSKILICGVAYKKDIEDTRNSPAEAIIKRLSELGADLEIYDPVVAKYSDTYLAHIISKELKPRRNYDAGIILADHSCMDQNGITASCELIMDTRGIFKNDQNIYSA